MPAYWVGRVKIHDPVEFKKYTDRLPPIFAKYNAKALTRGGKFEILEGPNNFDRHVVIEFPSLDQARACHDDPAYAEAMAYRATGNVATSEVMIIEGGDFTK
jgi:uncharacterized protein (DUF1330 family)